MIYLTDDDGVRLRFSGHFYVSGWPKELEHYSKVLGWRECHSIGRKDNVKKLYKEQAHGKTDA